MPEDRIGVLGASSLVGRFLLANWENSHIALSLLVAKKERRFMVALSVEAAALSGAINLGLAHPVGSGFALPIWIFSDHFELLESLGVRRIIVISSTSRFGKLDSPDISERELALKLAGAEDDLQRWADGKSIEWVILRPTVIYGLGQDKNVSEISRLLIVLVFSFFGQARGLRQPCMLMM